MYGRKNNDKHKGTCTSTDGCWEIIDVVRMILTMELWPHYRVWKELRAVRFDIVGFRPEVDYITMQL